MCKSCKIKDFTKLSPEEHKKVLEWRNSDFVARWMKSKRIDFQEHMRFVESLKKDKKRRYFLVEDKGVIYFTQKEGYVEIGLYRNPQKKGVGKELLKTLLALAFEKTSKVRLEVFQDNQVALALYKNFGFVELKREDKIVTMELDYENWKYRYR